MHASDFSLVAERGFRAAALALAALLLGTQILAALEYTDGAALYTRVSAVSVMVALAVLPAAFEYARRVRSPVLALSVVLTGTAFLAYSLPATLSRAADLRERAATAIAETVDAKQELKTANNVLNQCLSEKRRNCDAAERNVQRIERTKEKAVVTESSTPSDSGTAIMAYWTGLTPETVRRGGILLYGIGVELGIAVLVALGCRRPAVAPCAPVSPGVPPGLAGGTPRPPGSTAPEWINAFMDHAGQPLSIPEAFAIYTSERKGKRTMSVEKFTELFQREAKRRGMVVKTEGRRRLYAVA